LSRETGPETGRTLSNADSFGVQGKTPALQGSLVDNKL
jgi:hypothetical protein